MTDFEETGDGVSTLAEHKLAGEVERIVYESEDASYTVFRLRDAQGALFTAVGTVPGLTPGQTVQLSGKWEMHKEHGRQFRVSTCVFSLPATRDGLIKYLSSGVVKGIGEKYAQAIVDTFGAETLNVLNQQSRRLREVPGLGRKRIEAIRKAWKENADRRESQIYLQGLGINPAWFARIYDKYGNNAPEVIRENPYRLASEIKGIGFTYADKIAAQLGIGKNDVRRMTAGVTYGLLQARQAGHVCMPQAAFVKFLSELLDVDEGDAGTAIQKALETGRAASSVSHEGDVMIYEPGLLRCEDELPFIIRFLQTRERYAGVKLAQIAVPAASKFSQEQLLAVDRVSQSPITIITGGPGVGKTTVVSEIVRRAKLARLSVALAAPTGRAAKRMTEATGITSFTLHRLLKWEPETRRFSYGRGNQLPYDLFVLDETSMLDILLALAFFRAVKPGASVVIVGDPDQLPSVGPGNVLNDLIASGVCPVSRLTQIFRQGAGSGIIHAAHDVNNGVVPRLPRREKDAQADFYWIEKDAPEDAADVIERMITDRIPRRFGLDPVRDVQLLCPMNRGTVGTLAMNERLQEKLNPEKKFVFHSLGRTFKSGDKVMQIVNNYDKNVFNGDMGFLGRIDFKEETFQVRYESGPVVEYRFEEAEQIVPAYAVTVHKSQGCEFPAVVMPLLSQHYMMLQRNLLYTGITRARSLMVLVGSRKAVSMAVRNAVREPRYSLLLEKLITGGPMS